MEIEDEKQEMKRKSVAMGKRISLGTGMWIVWTNYCKVGVKEMMERVGLEQEEKGRIKILIGGDFNAITGEKCGICDGEGEGS